MGCDGGSCYALYETTCRIFCLLSHNFDCLQDATANVCPCIYLQIRFARASMFILIIGLSGTGFSRDEDEYNSKPTAV